MPTCMYMVAVIKQKLHDKETEKSLEILKL